MLILQYIKSMYKYEISNYKQELFNRNVDLRRYGLGDSIYLFDKEV